MAESILTVRRSVLIQARPERVWREFETFERLQAWFGTGHRLTEYEPRLGGTVRLEVGEPDAPEPFGGNIVVFEPANELTFENDWIPNRGWAAPTYITLRLTPALGGTLVELLHHGFERVGGDIGYEHLCYEGGWDNHHLVALREIVTGAQVASSAR